MSSPILPCVCLANTESRIILYAWPITKKACRPTPIWCCKAPRAPSTRLRRNGAFQLSPRDGYWSLLEQARGHQRSAFLLTCRLHQVIVARVACNQWFLYILDCVFIFCLGFSPSTEKECESFVCGSQKISASSPARASPEIPLLGPQSGKTVTPLDLGRFQSKVFCSMLNEVKPKDNTGTPQDAGHRNPQQKEASVQLDTPSRFLSKDQRFRPSFNLKVLT